MIIGCVFIEIFNWIMLFYKTTRVYLKASRRATGSWLGSLGVTQQNYFEENIVVILPVGWTVAVVFP